MYTSNSKSLSWLARHGWFWSSIKRFSFPKLDMDSCKLLTINVIGCFIQDSRRERSSNGNTLWIFLMALSFWSCSKSVPLLYLDLGEKGLLSSKANSSSLAMTLPTSIFKMMSYKTTWSVLAFGLCLLVLVVCITGFFEEQAAWATLFLRAASFLVFGET